MLESEERDENTIADEILGFVLEHGGTGWNKVADSGAVTGKGERLRAIPRQPSRVCGICHPPVEEQAA